MKKFLLVALMVFPAYIASAQDDLLKQLQNEAPAPKDQTVIATFKSDKIINIHTNETVKKGNLDFRVNHLFGNIGSQSGGGPHNLYGFDQSYDIRIGFHYGITDKLTLGVSRCKRHENLEGLVKYKILEQTASNSIPVGVTVFGNATYSTIDKSLVEKSIYRNTYLSQLIVTHKFSPKFSMAAVGSYLHRNLVDPDDKNDVIAVSGGLRMKITPSTAIILDYSHAFGREHLTTKYYDPIGAGIEIETGGHVFSIMFTNASGILENDYLVNTVDSWDKGGFKFSFIISRTFKLGK